MEQLEQERQEAPPWWVTERRRWQETEQELSLALQAARDKIARLEEAVVDAEKELSRNLDGWEKAMEEAQASWSKEREELQQQLATAAEASGKVDSGSKRWRAKAQELEEQVKALEAQLRERPVQDIDWARLVKLPLDLQPKELREVLKRSEAELQAIVNAQRDDYKELHERYEALKKENKDLKSKARRQ